MSSPQTWDEERESLLKHLEGVFALAQVVAPDADEAVRLVEDTYRQAFASPPAADSDEERRVQLFRLLLQTRSNPSEGEGGTSESSPDLAGFRRRLAVEFIDHALPPAFAALSSEKRLILILSDVQGLDCRLAGKVLDLSEEAACARLDEARSDLRTAVYAGATEAERRLLETGLSENWEKDAVSRMADTELAALPPTLRPSILSAIRATASRKRPRHRLKSRLCNPEALPGASSSGSSRSCLSWPSQGCWDTASPTSCSAVPKRA